MRTAYLIVALLAMAPASMAAPAKATLPTPVYKPSATTPAPAAAEQAARQVEDAFNRLTTLQATFTQRMTGDPAVREGTFVWKKPRQFVWNYTAPEAQKIISTGTAVYFLDVGRNQVTQLPLDAGLARLFTTPKLSLKGQGLAVAAVQETPTALTVTLTPLAGTSTAKTLKSMVLALGKTKAGLVLSRIETTDITRTTTAITLANVKVNAPVKASVFAFTPGVYAQQNEL